MNKTVSHGLEHITTLKMIVDLLLQHGNLTQDEIKVPCLWQLAKSNQLLLALGRAVVEQYGESFIPGEFLPDYQHLERLHKNTLSLIAELLSAFYQYNLPVLTIKSFLPFAFVDSNVDVVVVESERDVDYVQRLFELGFQHQFNLADVREPFKKAYGKDSWKQMNEVFPKVHLHRAISWNGINYLDLQRVAFRSQKWCQGDLEIPIPSPEDELLIMAAHALFENKFITLHELFYLTFITPHITDWPGVVAQASQYHWGPAFCRFVSIAATLAESVGLSLTLPASVQTVPNLVVRLPYLLPIRQTFAYSWRKLLQDVQAGHWRRLPRQLFTYSLVDAAWMYRKAWRKQRSVQSC